MNVFFINSSITYNVSIQIISFFDLNKDECLFLYSRNVNFETDIKSVDVSKYEGSFEIKINFLKSRKSVAELERLITSLTNSKKFHLFLAHRFIGIMELLINHPNCNEYSFIEEGMLAYKDYFVPLVNNPQRFKSKITDVVNWLNFGGKISKNSEKVFYNNRDLTKEFYCFSEKAFEFASNKTVLTLLKQDIDYEVKSLLILETVIEAYLVDASVYIDSIKKVLDLIVRTNIRELHYKFHPAQKESVLLLSDLFKNYSERIEFIKVPSHYNLEHIIINTKCDIYFTQSSVGLYGATNGNNLYSNLYDLRQSNPAMVEYVLEATPDFVKDRINYLN